MEKALSEFNRNKSNRHGVQSACRDCINAAYSGTTDRKALLIRQRYNITQQQYNALLVQQDFRCAGCSKHVSEFDKALAVDHNHKCCPGKTSCGECVRGLLCMKCNLAIGYVDDNTQTLRLLITYLEG